MKENEGEAETDLWKCCYWFYRVCWFCCV